MRKSTKKIIFEVIIGLLLSIGMFYLLIKSPTEKEKRLELKNKGFNQHKIDSIIKKQNDDMFGAIIHLAG